MKAKLIKMAKKYGVCSRLSDLQRCPDNAAALVNLLYRHWDFVAAKNFPTKAFLRQYKDDLAPLGVLVENPTAVIKQEKVALFDSAATVEATAYESRVIYAAGISSVAVRARHYSLVVVEAAGDATVDVEMSEGARVIVTLRDRAQLLHEVNNKNFKLINRNAVPNQQ